jgi:hypothetical protein
MRKTRNSNPNYTGVNEEVYSSKIKIRAMDDTEIDQFQNLNVQQTTRAMAPQTYYNKFKRIIMLENQWRDESLFKKAVIRLAKKQWAATPASELVFHLKKFHKTFSMGNITIRPLINYPTHIGVYATKNIKLNETIVGLDGLITVTASCLDSMVVLEDRIHSQLKKLVFFVAKV